MQSQDLEYEKKKNIYIFAKRKNKKKKKLIWRINWMVHQPQGFTLPLNVIWV